MTNKEIIKWIDERSERLQRQIEDWEDSIEKIDEDEFLSRKKKELTFYQNIRQKYEHKVDRKNVIPMSDSEISKWITKRTEELKELIPYIEEFSDERFKDDYLETRKRELNFYKYIKSDFEQIKEEQLLTDKELAYLKAICKPFKDRVLGIGIRKCWKIEASNAEQVVIEIVGQREYIFLPYFPQNALYKNLKRKMLYTLEELGIEYKN